jgi:hypothetical protein
MGSYKQKFNAVTGQFNLVPDSLIDLLGFTPEDVANKSTDTTLGGGSPSNTLYPTQAAIKAYADQLVSVANALVYKGAIDCSGNPNYPAADAGFLYVVSVAGKIGGGSGVVVEVGDLAICTSDSTPSGDQVTVGTRWNLIEKNDTGVVSGPTSSTDSNVAEFDSVSGKLIKDGGITHASISGSIAITGALGAGGTRVNPRSNGVATSATPAINIDTTDIFSLTALAEAVTSFTTNLTGTPVNGQKLIVRILDNGVAQTLAWGASFASRGVLLPTTTMASKYLYVGFIFNNITVTFDCVAVIQE